MRVLHVYRTYFPDSHGGLEEVIRQICESTKASNVESRVLSIANESHPQVVVRREATVYRARQTFEIASCNVSLRAFRLFRELVSWADIVHYHFPWPFADVLHLSARVDCPTVVTYHSDIVRQRFLGSIYRPVMNRFLRSVDEIVCTSENYFATSPVLYRFQDKVSIIPIGIDEDTYPSVSREDVDGVRCEFGSDFFLFVGVLRYYKGLHILLDAIKGAPYQVVIVGSGPTEAELKTQARSLGLDNVRFTGYVSNATKVALFKLSKAIVFPSYLRSEAFGVTLLEGAMYGKPLISTEVGSGTSHINIDRKTGFVVTPGSAKALRDAMDQLDDRPGLAHSMGIRARQRFSKLFTGSLMGDRYVELYRRLLAKAPESR
ncbi:MAG: glycosyltransferase [Pseudomonadales bacterium]